MAEQQNILRLPIGQGFAKVGAPQNQWHEQVEISEGLVQRCAAAVNGSWATEISAYRRQELDDIA